ncbi:MAG TPA: hypothetical protein O0X67_01175, partial [Methanocorpusculum sp.]|nr:hypothetical protein [Methanocorpusculum sp.]
SVLHKISKSGVGIVPVIVWFPPLMGKILVIGRGIRRITENLVAFIIRRQCDVSAVLVNPG